MCRAVRRAPLRGSKHAVRRAPLRGSKHAVRSPYCSPHSLRSCTLFTLVLTFAPPTMAHNGLLGASTAPCKYLSSLSSRYPAALSFMCSVTPAVELCALCAVPKASLQRVDVC